MILDAHWPDESRPGTDVATTTVETWPSPTDGAELP